MPRSFQRMDDEDEAYLVESSATKNPFVDGAPRGCDSEAFEQYTPSHKNVPDALDESDSARQRGNSTNKTSSLDSWMENQRMHQQQNPCDIGNGECTPIRQKGDDSRRSGEHGMGPKRDNGPRRGHRRTSSIEKMEGRHPPRDLMHEPGPVSNMRPSTWHGTEARGPQKGDKDQAQRQPGVNPRGARISKRSQSFRVRPKPNQLAREVPDYEENWGHQRNDSYGEQDYGYSQVLYPDDQQQRPHAPRGSPAGPRKGLPAPGDQPESTMAPRAGGRRSSLVEIGHRPNHTPGPRRSSLVEMGSRRQLVRAQSVRIDRRAIAGPASRGVRRQTSHDVDKLARPRSARPGGVEQQERGQARGRNPRHENREDQPRERPHNGVASQIVPQRRSLEELAQQHHSLDAHRSTNDEIGRLVDAVQKHFPANPSQQLGEHSQGHEGGPPEHEEKASSPGIESNNHQDSQGAAAAAAAAAGLKALSMKAKKRSEKRKNEQLEKEKERFAHLELMAKQLIEEDQDERPGRLSREPRDFGLNRPSPGSKLTRAHSTRHVSTFLNGEGKRKNLMLNAARRQNSVRSFGSPRPQDPSILRNLRVPPMQDNSESSSGRQGDEIDHLQKHDPHRGKHAMTDRSESRHDTRRGRNSILDRSDRGESHHSAASSKEPLGEAGVGKTKHRSSIHEEATGESHVGEISIEKPSQSPETGNVAEGDTTGANPSESQHKRKGLLNVIAKKKKEKADKLREKQLLKEKHKMKYVADLAKQLVNEGDDSMLADIDLDD